ncbi:MAG: acyl-CoA thioesterase [Myxococcota bacterium]|jgi:acyl-CoA thioesterase
MSAFLDASKWERTAPGAYTTEVDGAWSQGRGMFGGLIGAAVVRAVEETAGPDSGGLRSLHLHLCAPLRVGQARLFTKVERRGPGLVFVSARVLQGGKVAAFGSGCTGRARDRRLDFADAVCPVMAPASEVVPLGPSPLLPAFAKDHVEYRFAWGPAPLSGGDRAESGGWIRLREPSPLDPAMCAALLDAWPPAVYSRTDQPHVLGTTALAMHVVGELPPRDLPVDTAWGLTVHSRTTHAGFADEENRLWTPSGALLAVARQVVTFVR